MLLSGLVLNECCLVLMSAKLTVQNPIISILDLIRGDLGRGLGLGLGLFKTYGFSVKFD